MGMPIDEEVWKRATAAALAAIVEWRQEHPHASFDEIEDAITQRMRPLREQVLTDIIHTSTQTAFGEGTERPVCPTCGSRLQAKGRKRRTIVTHQGETISLERTGGHCPRCNAGLFPPGS